MAVSEGLNTAPETEILVFFLKMLICKSLFSIAILKYLLFLVIQNSFFNLKNNP